MRQTEWANQKNEQKNLIAFSLWGRFWRMKEKKRCYNNNEKYYKRRKPFDLWTRPDQNLFGSKSKCLYSGEISSIMMTDSEQIVIPEEGLLDLLRILRSVSGSQSDLFHGSFRSHCVCVIRGSNLCKSLQS